MKTINVPVLYGSQTGNSEAAAKSLSKILSSSLTTDTINVTSNALELDDFLEAHKAPWSPLAIIIVSSYGVGQAPLGAWKFREMCDKILESKEDKSSEFKGLKYALLGLGDSKFTTFFLNPTAIDSALSKAGAERVGSLGKADASGTGEKVQLKVIEDWSKNIIPDLKRVIEEDLGPLAIKTAENEEKDGWKQKEEEMSVVRENTLKYCRLIYENWQDGVEEPEDKESMLKLIIIAMSPAIILACLIKLLIIDRVKW